MAKAPTTQMSMKYLRKMGFTVDKVEHYNTFSHRYSDLFGVFDILAIREGEGIIGIQTTSASGFSSRVRKILDSHAAEVWLKAGGRIRVHGWHKPAHRWKVRDEEITHDRFARGHDAGSPGHAESAIP